VKGKSAKRKEATKSLRPSMGAIRSKGNQATELRLLLILRRQKIVGWRRHLRLPGTPDFAFRNAKIAVFVDGCFWHGCPRHYRKPRGNELYWEPKLRRNQARDRRVDRELQKLGWSVLRVWEHALKDEARVADRLMRAIMRKQIERKANCDLGKINSISEKSHGNRH
jgi:DNA mismatch endonuclease, patch repair protein